MMRSNSSTSNLVSSWLGGLRLRHTFLVVGRLQGDGGVRIEGEKIAAFHYCLRGSCVVAPEGEPPVALDEGSFLFMPRGLPREIRFGAGPRRGEPASLRALLPKIRRDTAMSFTIGSGPREQVVLGGAFCLDNPESRPFLAALPPVLCVHSGAPYMTRLRTIFEELVAEAASSAAAAGPVVARLSEVAVLIGLRAFLASDDPGCALVSAARDPRLGRALEAIHHEPTRAWTIASLSRVAGMSRSGFAATFTETVRQTPAAYLTAVRLARAERLLLERDWSLPRVAEAVGYASPAAFSVAFKRATGVPPSVLRKRRQAARDADGAPTA